MSKEKTTAQKPPEFVQPELDGTIPQKTPKEHLFLHINITTGKNRFKHNVTRPVHCDYELLMQLYKLERLLDTLANKYNTTFLYGDQRDLLTNKNI